MLQAMCVQELKRLYVSVHVSVGWWLMISMMIKVVITLPGKWRHRGCCFVWGVHKQITILCSSHHHPLAWLSINQVCVCMYVCVAFGLWHVAGYYSNRICVCVCLRTGATEHVWHLKLGNVPGRKTTQPCQTQRRQHHSCEADYDDKLQTHTRRQTWWLIHLN